MCRLLSVFVVAWLAMALGSTSVVAQTLTVFYDFEGIDADRFDDPAGDFADDLVGQFNPAFSTDTPAVTGSTQSASFDGNSALFTDAYTTDLGPDPDAFTIMFWIKARDIDQENNNTRLISTRRLPDGQSTTGRPWQVEGFGDPDNNDGDSTNDGQNGDAMDVRYQPTNGIYPQNWFSPDATNALARDDQGETMAEWRHVAFVLSNSGDPGDGGAYGETYVDGESVNLSGQNPDWDGFSLENTEGQLIIGGDAENAGTRAFVGLLDDFALFAGIVDPLDIANIAAGTLSPLDIGGPGFLLGDTNNDGTVDTLDIDPFVLLLTDPAGYAAAFPGVDPLAVGDINMDTVVDTLDIDPFVALLTAGSLTGAGSVPEPASLALLAIGGLVVVLRRQF